MTSIAWKPISRWIRISLVATATSVLHLAAGGPAAAEYPDRPIRMVVAYAAGGTGTRTMVIA